MEACFLIRQVGLEAEASSLRHKLELTEAALDASSSAEHAARQALEKLAARANAPHSRADSHALEAKVQLPY